MGYATIIIELRDENEGLKRQNQLLETRNKLKQIEYTQLRMNMENKLVERQLQINQIGMINMENELLKKKLLQAANFKNKITKPEISIKRKCVPFTSKIPRAIKTQNSDNPKKC